MTDLTKVKLLRNTETGAIFPWTEELADLVEMVPLDNEQTQAFFEGIRRSAPGRSERTYASQAPVSDELLEARKAELEALNEQLVQARAQLTNLAAVGEGVPGPAPTSTPTVIDHEPTPVEMAPETPESEPADVEVVKGDEDVEAPTAKIKIQKPTKAEQKAAKEADEKAAAEKAAKEAALVEPTLDTQPADQPTIATDPADVLGKL